MNGEAITWREPTGRGLTRVTWGRRADITRCTGPGDSAVNLIIIVCVVKFTDPGNSRYRRCGSRGLR